MRNEGVVEEKLVMYGMIWVYYRCNMHICTVQVVVTHRGFAKKPASSFLLPFLWMGHFLR